MLPAVLKIPERRQLEKRKVMAHGRHVAFKTKVEAKKEASSTSSENSAERAICRQGLAGAGRLAIRIDRWFPVSEGKGQHRGPVGLQIYW